ncbi:MAG: phosphoribosylglycinamide formyltransferase [Chthonomonas sp.]|nr:phosphoribosylglycinamide formyltransferase [Chthonomonas sp.]
MPGVFQAGTICVVQARMVILVGSRGRGSNMANLVTACSDGRLAADPVLVICARIDAPACAVATQLGITVEVVSPKSESYASGLMRVLESARPTVICLAGYMSLLPRIVVQAFAGRILNIHPALLPKYGGKGMYGMHVHEAVLAHGESESGCTVHLVTEEYDEGAILLQKRCEVLSDDTVETLAARVLQLEHQAYPEAVATLLAGVKS